MEDSWRGQYQRYQRARNTAGFVDAQIEPSGVGGRMGHIVSPEQVSRRSEVGVSPAKRATGSCSGLTQSDASPHGGVRRYPLARVLQWHWNLGCRTLIWILVHLNILS